MSTSTRRILTVTVVIIGLVLMAGGIMTDKNGAVVVGLCVAAVATQRWMALKK